ncbi:YopX family protein [Staphylococcus aureus]
MITKFRAWDKEEKEWLSIRTIGFDDDGSLWYLQAWDENENDIDPPYLEDDLGVKWELLQSTGIKDRNSVEIFEGDVVKTKYGKHGRYIGVVTFISGKFISKGVKQYKDSTEELDGAFEIIGNKYEHPQLLERVMASDYKFRKSYGAYA